MERNKTPLGHQKRKALPADGSRIELSLETVAPRRATTPSPRVAKEVRTSDAERHNHGRNRSGRRSVWPEDSQEIAIGQQRSSASVRRTWYNSHELTPQPDLASRVAAL